MRRSLLRFIGGGAGDVRELVLMSAEVDKAHGRSLVQPVNEYGTIAAWIAPPRNGINGEPVDYDYVHLA